MANTAENAKLEYEAGQNAVTMTALTNSGDETTFTSAASLWSSRSGYAPVVRPNGLLTGGAITPSGTNDVVNVAALTLNLNGVVTSVSNGTATITRGLTTDTHNITSITINASGAIAAVSGTDGTAFSATRGAAGGPPLIAVDSVEIGQVRTTSVSAGVVLPSEIFQVVGLHQERADFPLFNINYDAGSVTFLAELPEIHTGPTPKKVFASFASPIFAEVGLATDFVPPETTHSVTSTQIYNTTLGSTTSTLGQGSFTAFLEDGVSDGLVKLKNEVLWFKFYPDRYKSPYLLAQGKLGVSRTFPAGDNIQAACTISASKTAVEVS
jgi:hypothetical protein